MSAPQSILPLEIRKLVFESGDTRLLHDIDVTLSAGRRTIILGPNGAGKSLLLRLCHGLLKPTSGEIIWRGAGTSRRVIRRSGHGVPAPGHAAPDGDRQHSAHAENS